MDYNVFVTLLNRSDHPRRPTFGSPHPLPEGLRLCLTRVVHGPIPNPLKEHPHVLRTPALHTRPATAIMPLMLWV